MQRRAADSILAQKQHYGIFALLFLWFYLTVLLRGNDSAWMKISIVANSTASNPTPPPLLSTNTTSHKITTAPSHTPPCPRTERKGQPAVNHDQTPHRDARWPRPAVSVPPDAVRQGGSRSARCAEMTPGACACDGRRRRCEGSGMRHLWAGGGI